MASPLRLAATAHGLPAVQSDHFAERGFGGFLRNTAAGATNVSFISPGCQDTIYWNPGQDCQERGN